MSATMSSAEATPSVNWEQPGDEQMFWQLDRMHFPNQLSLMEDDFIKFFYAEGFSAAAAGYEMPVRPHVRRMLTRHYLTIAPLPLSHDELEDLGKRFEQHLGSAMPRQQQRWDAEFLPELRRLLAEWESFDLRAASDADLRA
jgi:hypothetical protein